MSRIVAFVDGFNLYHALHDHKQYHKYKWISLWRLAQAYVFGSDTLEAVHYFTTLASWDAGKVKKHQLFIKAQRAEGVNVVFGEFKRKQKYCPNCRTMFWTVEEKQTDVNIALALFQTAVTDDYDRAVLISGDTDLIPAIKAVRQTFPGKEIAAVIPISRASEDLKNNADVVYKMKEHQLQKSLLPDPYVLADGTPLACPNEWK